MKKGNMWILGGFNFPKLQWDPDYVPIIRSGHSYPPIYKDFVSCLDDFGLVQMVIKPIRGDNILDLLLTTNPTLVNSVEILPGLSDHDISISKASVKPKISRQNPRSVPLGKLTGLVSNLLWRLKCRKFLASFQENTVEEIWNAFKLL